MPRTLSLGQFEFHPNSSSNLAACSKLLLAPSGKDRQPASLPCDPFRQNIRQMVMITSTRPVRAATPCRSPAIPAVLRGQARCWALVQQNISGRCTRARAIITRRFSRPTSRPPSDRAGTIRPEQGRAHPGRWHAWDSDDHQIWPQRGARKETARPWSASPRVTEVRSPGSSVATTPGVTQLLHFPPIPAIHFHFHVVHEPWDSTRKSWP